jgi:undecaprenyl-diphosphatase
MAGLTQNYLPRKNQLIGSVVLLLVAVVVLPQLGGFNESLHLLQHLDVGGVLLAFGLTMATYAAAGGTYYFLAFRPLDYRKTVIAQFAAMFANRLLPSGVGAAGANYAYLRAHRQTATQAATMVAVNNLFGLLGHSIVVAITVGFFATDLPPLMKPHITGPWLYITLLALLAIGIAVCLLTSARRKVVRIAQDVTRQVGVYRQRPIRLSAALLSSIALTLCNMLSLYACVLAVGGHTSFAVVCVVFTFGISASTAIPTPGGLGGFEAGLLAGFIGYHMPHATALAAVVLYRLISYWLTLVLGGGVFFYANHRGYFSHR